MQLEQLRRKIAKIEHRHVSFSPVADDHALPWQTGCAAIDDVLPNGQLARSALHDFSTPRPRDTPAMDRFALGLLRRYLTIASGEVIWCQSGLNIREHGHPYGPGLKALGLLPERLLIVTLGKEKDLAFAMEESLRSHAVAAVIGEGEPLGFTASRRLSLACQEMATPCLFLNTSSRFEASAATTRWRIAPAIGPPDAGDPDGPGRAAWSVSLLRARGGRAHLYSPPWSIFWNDETYSFNLVTTHGDGTLAERPKARTPFSTSFHTFGTKKRAG